MSSWHFIPCLEKWSKVISRLEKLVTSAARCLARSSCKVSWHFGSAWILCAIFFLHISFLLLMNPRTIKMDFCSHHSSLSRRERGGACSDSLMRCYVCSLFWWWSNEQQICALKMTCCPALRSTWPVCHRFLLGKAGRLARLLFSKYKVILWKLT